MFKQAKMSLRNSNTRKAEVKICEHLKIVTLDLNFIGSYTEKDDCTPRLIFRSTGEGLFI